MWTITKLIGKVRKYDVVWSPQALLKLMDQGWDVLSESETEKVRKGSLFLATVNVKKYQDRVA